jgi:hypothetical protein
MRPGDDRAMTAMHAIEIAERDARPRAAGGMARQSSKISIIVGPSGPSSCGPACSLASCRGMAGWSVRKKAYIGKRSR